MELFGCLGKKIGMTQILKENKEGRNFSVPVTAIWVGDNFVLQKKNKEKDGYEACQIAFEQRSIKTTIRPLLKRFDKAGITPKKNIKEIRDMTMEQLEVGSCLDIVSKFIEGKKIKISGKTKGKGFSGVIKKYGFSRGGMTHGSGYPHRRIGSLCFGRGDGQKIVKGKKMPSRMGGKTVTKMTKIEKIDKQGELIFVRGSVPGLKKGLIILKQLIF